jgi:hypothetical protein
MATLDPVEECERKIRELAMEKFGIEPLNTNALILHRYSDEWRVEAIAVDGVTLLRLQEFIAWFNKNHRDMLPPL